MFRDVNLSGNPVSVAGMVLTTVSAVLFLIVFFAELFGFHANPYIGIVFFLLLPGGFLAGLALIPVGAWLERRRRRAGQPPSELKWPRVDLNDRTQRWTAAWIFMLTVANVVIVSLAAYRGVEYMDSVEFCGQVCHAVMRPEFVAHQDAPHSRVTCVQCHVGPGAAGFAQAKASGVGQLVALALGTVPRPLPAPVEHMRPASDTCERCHWPEKLHGDTIKRVHEYADDEANTETVTTLRLHVGGGSEPETASGIHWHMNVASDVEYIAADETRREIPYVRVKDRSGSIREYVSEGMAAEQFAAGARRRMDCMDCHNRPSHPMAPSAERAVDQVIARGEIPRTLPFVRREAVRALKAPYPDEREALEAIAKGLREFYRGEHGEIYATRRQDVEKAVAGTQGVYRRSVFPEMNVQFGTYPNHIGHVDSPGCFRCHDDRHTTADGKVISQDCGTCHTIE